MLPETPAVALREELGFTSELIRKYLGRECIGLRTPFGYYRGLRDRPGPARDRRGDRPPLRHLVGPERGQRQPDAVGAAVRVRGGRLPRPARDPVPVLARRDLVRRARLRRRARVPAALEGAIDEIAEQDLVFATAFHEWCAIEADEEGTGWIRGLLEHARRAGVEITTYTDYWARTTGAQAPAAAGQAAGPAP